MTQISVRWSNWTYRRPFGLHGKEEPAACRLHTAPRRNWQPIPSKTKALSTENLKQFTVILNVDTQNTSVYELDCKDATINYVWYIRHFVRVRIFYVCDFFVIYSYCIDLYFNIKKKYFASLVMAVNNIFQICHESVIQSRLL